MTTISSLLNHRNKGGTLASLEDTETDSISYIIETLQDNVAEEVKLQLLLMLQEECTQLLKTNHSWRVAAETLFNLHRSSDISDFLHSQLLCTITTIFICGNVMSFDQSLMSRFIDALLEAASDETRSSSSRLVRDASATCLNELDQAYPGLLSERIWQLVIGWERLPTASSSLLLLTSLNNCLHRMACNNHRMTAEILTETLRPHRRMNLPFTLPEALNFTQPYVKKQSSEALTEVVRPLELFRLLGQILEQLLLLPFASLISIIPHISSLHTILTQFPVVIFKPFILRHTASMDHSIIHTVLHLQFTFGLRLFTEVEEKGLFNRLVSQTTHIGLSSAQQLLTLSWIRSLLQQERKNLLSELSIQHQHMLYPRFVLTGDFTLKLIRCLSSAVSSTNSSSDKDGLRSSLLGAVSVLQRKAELGLLSSVQLSALFKSLFTLSCQHDDSDLQSDIERQLVSLLLKQPQYHAHLADFIHSIQSLQPDSRQALNILTSITTQLVSDDVKDDARDDVMLDRLELLALAASDNRLNVLPIVSFCRRVLCPNCRDGSWELGQTALDLIRALMLHVTLDRYLSDLLDLLYTFMCNHGDLCTRQRSLFYYNMLVHLSSAKLKLLLHESLSESENLTAFVGGTEGYLPAAEPVALETCPFRLELKSEFAKSVQSDDTECLELDFCLSLADDTAISEAHVIQMMSVGALQCNDIILAFLSLGQKEEFSVIIKPSQPMPRLLQLRAIFAAADHTLYQTTLVSSPLAASRLWLPGVTSHSPSALWNQKREIKGSIESVMRTSLSGTSLHPGPPLLQPYYLPNDPKYPNEKWAYMRLLPADWLILRLVPDNVTTIVNILVSDVNLLSDVMEYLNSIEGQSIIS